MRKPSAAPFPSLSVRIDLDTERSNGPGNIQLVESILSCGSISAASRAMKMVMGGGSGLKHVRDGPMSHCYRSTSVM
jgi:hypothetical protein